MLTLLINLDRAPGRLKKIGALLRQWDIPFTRLPGCDARQMTEEELAKYRQPYAEREYFLKDFTAGEIGCMMSHMKAWQTLVDSHHEWACVLEDDFAFDRDPRPYLLSTDWIPEGVKLVQLAKEYKEPKKVRCEPDIIPLKTGDRLMVLWEGIDGGCQGYLIHRDVAKYLVEANTPHFFAPSDDALFSHASPLRRHFAPWSLSPALIYADDGRVSCIGGEKGHVKTSFWRGPGQYLTRKKINLLTKIKARYQCVPETR